MAFQSKDSVINLADMMLQQRQAHRQGASEKHFVHDDETSFCSSSSSSSSPLNASPTLSLERKESCLVEDDYTTWYEYDPTTALLAQEKQQQRRHGINLLHCLFPWTTTTTTTTTATPKKKAQKVATRAETPPNKEAEISEQEQPFKETVFDTDKAEEQNLLATAGIVSGTDKPQPNEATAADGKKENNNSQRKAPTMKREANLKCSSLDEREDDTFRDGEAFKGILKSSASSFRETSVTDDTATNNQNIGRQRRSLFARTYSSDALKCQKYAERQNQKVKFCNLASVATVPCLTDLEPWEKSMIWWQPQDFADFKQTSRLVTQVMMQVGADDWLKAKDPSWNNTNNDDKETTTTDKWWRTFGHSRRGLEHITSPEEGQERQRNVKLSIAAVLYEQHRQRLLDLPSGPQRLRQVYVSKSAWARKLSLAAAAQDEEAVKSNFVRHARSRTQFLQNQDMFGSSTTISHSELPAFMQRRMVGTTTNAPLLETNVQIIVRDDAPANANRYQKMTKGYDGTAGNTDMSAVLSGIGAAERHATSVMTSKKESCTKQGAGSATTS